MASHLRPISAKPVVVVRALLVVIAAAAVGAAVAMTWCADLGAPHRYTCPMHHEVAAAGPGDCPICGMALQDAAAARAAAREPSGPPAPIAFSTLRSSAEATNLLRFSVAQVRRNALPGEIYAPAIVDGEGRIVAQLYRDELAALADDERAELIPASDPGAPIAVKRDTAPPAVHAALADVGYRVERGRPPPPGEVGWIKLAYQVRAMLVVRSAAILWSPDGPYVLVFNLCGSPSGAAPPPRTLHALRDGSRDPIVDCPEGFSAERGGLIRRRIEIGKDYAGMTAVVSGLVDKEVVVMANTFAFDAERRLQGAL